ncbi:MAG: hypothetical protein JWN62_2501 [Acidimicrobiales bacterium]|nr:hypothetical protein [Acidimicrobiales bacterium]
MRLLTKAGMVVVIGVLGTSCTGKPDRANDGVTGPATPMTSTTSTADGALIAATSATPTTTVTALTDHEEPSSAVPKTSVDDGCDSTLPSTTFPGDGLNTFHTLVPGTSVLRFVVEATPTTVCPGGVIHLTVSMHNPTDHPLTEAPALVITDVYPHVVIAALAPAEVLAGATVAVATDATVPEIPAGKHEIFVLNASSPEGATINVQLPPLG